MARIWESDVSPAGWIGPRLNPWFQDTGSIVPVGFDAYARVFHPAGSRQKERWADIAHRNGRIAHPEMQLHRISRPIGEAGHHSHPNDLGDGFTFSPPREVVAALIEILRTHTSTPDSCCFCAWEGYGLDEDRTVPRVELPGRAYLLARGPIADADRGWPDEVPNLWWPEDQAWIVVSEIDFAWTYVGGSVAAIDQVLSAPDLEALPARIDHRPFYDSDLLNADPADERDVRPSADRRRRS